MVRTQYFLKAAGVAVALFLVTLAGCDVRVLYPEIPDHDDELVDNDLEDNDDVTVEDTALLAVVQPDGSEPYYPLDTIAIEWTGDVEADYVTIDLYRYGRFLQSVSERAANTGSYQWTIPADFDAVSEIVDQYQVSVRAAHPDHAPGQLFLEARSEEFTIMPGATGGLSDVTVSQRIVTITVTDNGTEIDDDTIDIVLNGETVAAAHVLVAEPGTDFELVLQEGANTLEIVAVNEGSVSPNTAELAISNVTEGEAVQEWRLATGESGALTITAP